MFVLYLQFKKKDAASWVSNLSKFELSALEEVFLELLDDKLKKERKKKKTRRGEKQTCSKSMVGASLSFQQKKTPFPSYWKIQKNSKKKKDKEES